MPKLYQSNGSGWEEASRMSLYESDGTIWHKVGVADGGSFVIPRNLGEVGDGADTSTLATTYALQLQKDDVITGDGILVFAMAASVPSTGATPGYPVSCADSLGNTYTLLSLHKFEAATPAVNDGTALAVFFCQSSSGVIAKGGTGRITVTWSNNVYDRRVHAFRVVHDGGALTPSVLTATADNDTTVKAATGLSLTIPAWTAPRANALVFAYPIFASASSGPSSWSVGGGGYTGFFEDSFFGWSSSRMNNASWIHTHGANVYLVTGSSVNQYEIDLGTLGPGLLASFNGFSQNYGSGAGNWKGVVVLAIQ